METTAPRPKAIARREREESRRAIDVVDELRFDLTLLESTVRALRREIGELRARVRELERDLDDRPADREARRRGAVPLPTRARRLGAAVGVVVAERAAREAQPAHARDGRTNIIASDRRPTPAIRGKGESRK
ncbi:MAG TPA: hypothetical protein VNE82_12760 [Candidatus Binataceae bacterium]|nr:hypothetical protein [Candidatus Binataceae bacterium]